MSMPEPAGLRLTDGMALNWGDPSSWVTRFHSASAIFASASVAFTVTLIDLLLDERMNSCTGRNSDFDLVPHPLADGGEVEVLSPDGIAVEERDSASGWVAVRGPVSSFEEPSAEDSEFDDFSPDAVDLNPVPDSDAVWAHEDKPSTKGEDEVPGRRRGESSCCEAKDHWHLLGDSEDDQQDEQEADKLGSQVDDRLERLSLPMIVQESFKRAPPLVESPAYKYVSARKGQQ